MALPNAPDGKVIWIDLDNTPHVPFFAPIIQELEARGFSIKLTVRDAYQACELADFFKLKYHRVGRHYGKNRILKIAGTCLRAAQLMWIVRKWSPDLALGHFPRSMTIASAILGIPCLQIIDYEYGASAGFAKPTWVMVPDVIPASKMGTEDVLTYPGIKEDVYVPRFVPDSSILPRLGITERDLVVILRPPANEAHYRKPASDELFDTVVHLLAETPNAKGIVLPRNHRQEKSVRERWPELVRTGKLLIPEEVMDGLNLIWHSDLVISGGGTMNREAAALRVPVYSIFRGTIGAVDQYLARQGRLVLIESVGDVREKIALKKRQVDQSADVGNRATLMSIVDQVVHIVEHGTPARPPVANPPEIVVGGARS